jgi:hypothetical protein
VIAVHKTEKNDQGFTSIKKNLDLLVQVTATCLTERVTKGLCLPSLSIQEMEGQSFFFFFWFFHLFINKLNNEDRWQVPDRFDLSIRANTNALTEK